MPNPAFTLQDLENQIQEGLYNDPSGVTPGSDNDKSYQLQINRHISTWENNRDNLWQELYVLQSDAATVAAGSTAFDLEEDFKEMGGKFARLKLTNGNITWRPIITLPNSQLDVQNNKKCFWYTGNPADGYQMIYGWTPAAGDVEIGAQISYVYYKTALQVSSPTDVLEMSDPMFVVHKTIATIALINQNPSLSAVANAEAAESLANMSKRNEAAGYFIENRLAGMDRLLGKHGYRIPNRMWSGYWEGLGS